MEILLAMCFQPTSEVVSEMFKDLGHKVRVAKDGQEVVDIVRQGEKVDLILISFDLKPLNGAEIAEAIRLNSQECKAKIVITTHLPTGITLRHTRADKVIDEAKLTVDELQKLFC